MGKKLLNMNFSIFLYCLETPWADLPCVGYKDSPLSPLTSPLAHAASSLSPSSSLKLQVIFISVFCSVRQDLTVWILFEFI